MAASSCDKKPVAPPPPPVPPLSLLCPPPTTGLSVDSLDGQTGKVNIIASVQPSGGVPPASINCPGYMDGVFPIGTTSVSCTGQDSAGQTATCAFPVTVNSTAVLQYTKFLAFGDSITYGIYAPPLTINGRRVHGVNIPGSYPSVLLELMTARYRQQVMTVVNAGEQGERLWVPTIDLLPVNPAALTRLKAELDFSRPDVLLLMEGTNDLLDGDSRFNAYGALDILLSEAQQRGIVVLLSNLTPSTKDARPALLPGFNDFVQDLARRRNAVFVDMFARFNGVPGLIGSDGLHPTTEGFIVMAQTWLDALKRFETNPAPSSGTPAMFSRPGTRPLAGGAR